MKRPRLRRSEWSTQDTLFSALAVTAFTLVLVGLGYALFDDVDKGLIFAIVALILVLIPLRFNE
jgi:predicted PurR-regulated permease PerM